MPVEDTDLDTLLQGHRHVDLKHIANLPSTLFTTSVLLTLGTFSVRVMLSDPSSISRLRTTLTQSGRQTSTSRIQTRIGPDPTALVGHTAFCKDASAKTIVPPYVHAYSMKRDSLEEGVKWECGLSCACGNECSNRVQHFINDVGLLIRVQNRLPRCPWSLHLGLRRLRTRDGVSKKTCSLFG